MIISADMSKEELSACQARLQSEYDRFKNCNLQLNMSRGNPSVEQLDLSNGILTVPMDNYITAEGVDVRNYGILDGIKEAKKLFSDLLDIKEKNIIIGGNSSLNLIYDAFVRLYIFGKLGSTPWGKLDKVKIICPVPGYDRHFTICEEFGFEMISVPFTPEGLDMDAIEKLVAEDESIKGIICVPMYSNPTGFCFRDTTVERLVSMKTAAEDFTIFWDNAYAIHHIYKERQIKNIFELAEQYGTSDRVLYFFSTSKVVFPGSGVAIVASGDNYIEEVKKHFGKQTIGYNKINQLRTYNFFKNADGIREHMKKLGAILRTKFDLVLNTLDKEFGENGILTWSKPDGGYFITAYTLEGCAKETVRLAAECGLILTPAGACFPYGNDPCDNTIRIAPSYPNLGALQNAADVFCICVKLATIKKLLDK